MGAALPAVLQDVPAFQVSEQSQVRSAVVFTEEDLRTGMGELGFDVSDSAWAQRHIRYKGLICDRRNLEYKGIILGSPEGDELVGTALARDAGARKGQAERMKQRAEIMTDRSSDRSFMEYLADRARQQIALRGTGTASRSKVISGVRC